MKSVYLFFTLFYLGLTAAFTTQQTTSFRAKQSFLLDSAEEPAVSENPRANTNSIEAFLAKKYPSFYKIFLRNEEACKKLRNGQPHTIFAPNKEAFVNIGEKKQKQLADPRNQETVEKVVAYHFIESEAVDAERLRREDWTVPKKDGKPVLTIGGVKTMGGDVRVGRSKSGGVLGIGAKEDGGIVIGPRAKIVQSVKIGECFVHEVDAFVNPDILWRYMDILRIL